MESEFSDQVVLVTGSASGIGRAAVKRFAEEGALVIGADQNVELGEDAAGELRSHGRHCVFHPCDVSRPDQVAQLFKFIDVEYGRLDVAFNNAGKGMTPTPASDVTFETWNEILQVNLTGMWLCLHEEIARMQTKRKGRIVNCASIASLLGIPYQVPYSVSKHGILGLTRSLALEMAESGLRINAVCPGPIRTPLLDRMTEGDYESLQQVSPMSRVAEPDEVAEAVLWLCSDQCSYILGQGLVIDGGWSVQ